MEKFHLKLCQLRSSFYASCKFSDELLSIVFSYQGQSFLHVPHNMPKMMPNNVLSDCKRVTYTALFRKTDNKIFFG